ncbi:MAG: hypothetical protein DSY76_06810 [Bacteroidetes bacterium]|nr:MAG: hypothetical protein DSY76_06810 [Bacteroidota bacterium]
MIKKIWGFSNQLKYGIIFLILIVTSQQLFASKSQNDTITKRPLSIYIRPVAMLASFPSFQLGVDYELPVGARFGLVLGYGSYMSARVPDAEVVDYSLYEFHPQIQIFISKKEAKRRFALGVEFVYVDISSHLRDGMYNKSTNQLVTFDRATYTENRRLFHVLASFVPKPIGHFLFEAYIGVGYGSRYVHYNNVENESPYYGGSSWLSIPSAKSNDRSIGEQGGLSGTIGLKIGYHF